MAESEQCILIIQSDDFQRLIWETVLQSQKLMVFTDNGDRSPLELLQELNQQPGPLALAMVDWNLVREDWEDWFALCQAQTPPLKTVLLLSKNIRPIERQAAEQTEAEDTIYWVSRKNLIGNVIAGTRRILDLLDDVVLDRDALVTSLVQFKRLLADAGGVSGLRQGGKPSMNQNPLKRSKPQPPKKPPNPSPSDSSDNPKRRYRGQTY